MALLGKFSPKNKGTRNKNGTEVNITLRKKYLEFVRIVIYLQRYFCQLIH